MIKFYSSKRDQCNSSQKRNNSDRIRTRNLQLTKQMPLPFGPGRHEKQKALEDEPFIFTQCIVFNLIFHGKPLKTKPLLQRVSNKISTDKEANGVYFGSLTLGKCLNTWGLVSYPVHLFLSLILNWESNEINYNKTLNLLLLQMKIKLIFW